MIFKHITILTSPLKEQLELIREISDIIKKQILDIDKKGQSESFPDSIEEFKRVRILFAKKSYLVFFNDIVQFLWEKLKNEEEKNFRFYLPNVRTLSDIYSQLLFLCNQSENRQTAICVADSLFTLAQAITGPREEIVRLMKIGNQRLKEAYEKGYEHAKPFLEKQGINIPRNIEDCSRSQLNRLNLIFPPIRDRVKTEYIERFSHKSVGVFPGACQTIIETHKGFSSYVHGNILYIGSHGTERFWIISRIQIICSLTVELINIEMPSIAQNLIFEKWLEKVILKKPKFVKLWKESRPHSSK